MKPSTKACLDLLREAGDDGVTTGDFARHYHARFGARLHELTVQYCCEIDSEPINPKQPRGPQRYFLRYEPEPDDIEAPSPADPPQSARSLGAVEAPVLAGDEPGGSTSASTLSTGHTEGEREGRDSAATLFDLVDIDIPRPPKLLDVDEAA